MPVLAFTPYVNTLGSILFFMTQAQIWSALPSGLFFSNDMTFHYLQREGGEMK